MLTIGKRRPAHDVVDVLLECHERIRAFTAMAARLASASAPPPREVAEAAAKVRRYFADALPLHAADEEESILPRLRGRDPDVDRELAAMHREHGEHEPVLARVVALCAALAEDPSRHAELAPELGDAAEELARHFEAHLAREEQVVFPAIRRTLGEAERARVAEELRARRGG
jgi:iron-sulfur cluster repair protein YtfE (RIC family)